MNQDLNDSYDELIRELSSVAATSNSYARPTPRLRSYPFDLAGSDEFNNRSPLFGQLGDVFPSSPDLAYRQTLVGQSQITPPRTRYPSTLSSDLERPTPVKKAPLVALLQSRPVFPSSSGFAVLKITNISWETMISDVHAFFHPIEVWLN